MTVRELATLLTSLPADCQTLQVEVGQPPITRVVSIVLLDPPGNAMGARPSCVLTWSAVGDVNDVAYVSEAARKAFGGK